MLLVACGDEETQQQVENESATESEEKEAPTSEEPAGPAFDLKAVLDTKLYGFRPLPERMKVAESVAVGTYVTARQSPTGAHLKLEVTISPCAGCTPTTDRRMWKLKTQHLLRARQKIDESANLEWEQVTWSGKAGIGTYSLLFGAKKAARGKVFQAEHAYSARFTDGSHLVELKASPSNAEGHPFATSRVELTKATTKKVLKKTVRHAWAKIGKHFPGIGE